MAESYTAFDFDSSFIVRFSFMLRKNLITLQRENACLKGKWKKGATVLKPRWTENVPFSDVWSTNNTTRQIPFHLEL